MTTNRGAGGRGPVNVFGEGERADQAFEGLLRWVQVVEASDGRFLEDAVSDLRSLGMPRKELRAEMKSAWQIRQTYRRATPDEQAGSIKEFGKRFERAWGARPRTLRRDDPLWASELKTTREGMVRRWASNLMLILENAEALRGLFQWNDQASRIDVMRKPPWPEGSAGGLFPREVHDADYSALQIYCQERWEADFSLDSVCRPVVATLAQRHSYNPLQDYLSSLQWDGVERCESWLSEFCAVEPSPYVRAVAVRWAIQAVQRAFEPGCQADHVLVLEGDQGLGKSRALRALAMRDEWFADSRINVEDQRAAGSRIQGKWIYELAEFPQRKVDSDKLKDFVTNSVDRYRDYYGRTEVDRPRRCVFAATINPPKGGAGYLSDPTGARRFWPVRIEKPIDVSAIKAAAPQIWAEAVVRYRRGELSYLESSELAALAREQQEDRAPSDPWAAQLEHFAEFKDELTTLDVLEQLNIPAERRTKHTEMRAAAALDVLGFRPAGERRRIGSVRLRIYRREPPPVQWTGSETAKERQNYGG